MSTRIRLMRLGAKKRPHYRVVVADQRSARDGRFIENIGKYHPLEDPSVIEIDEERALHWLRVGAQPSESVLNLLAKAGIWERFAAERPSAAARPKPERAPKPAAGRRSKKAQAKEAEPAAEAPEPLAAQAPPAEEETAAAADAEATKSDTDEGEGQA